MGLVALGPTAFNGILTNFTVYILCKESILDLTLTHKSPDNELVLYIYIFFFEEGSSQLVSKLMWKSVVQFSQQSNPPYYHTPLNAATGIKGRRVVKSSLGGRLNIQLVILLARSVMNRTTVYWLQFGCGVVHWDMWTLGNGSQVGSGDVSIWPSNTQVNDRKWRRKKIAYKEKCIRFASRARSPSASAKLAVSCGREEIHAHSV